MVDFTLQLNFNFQLIELIYLIAKSLYPGILIQKSLLSNKKNETATATWRSPVAVLMNPIILIIYSMEP